MANKKVEWIQMASGAMVVASLTGSVCGQSCLNFVYEPGGGEVSIAGATLFVDFTNSPASTNDYIDADGDGCGASCLPLGGDQLAPPYNPAVPVLNVFMEVQYRSVGSINGYKEFITWQTCGLLNKSVPSELGIMNGYIWATGGTKNADAQGECDYVLGDTNGDGWVLPGQDGLVANDPGSPASINGIDIAILDVPALWGTIRPDGSNTSWDAVPGGLGYGNNPLPAANAAYFSPLPSLCRDCDGGPSGTLVDGCDPLLNPDCFCLNTNNNPPTTANPDSNTIYDNTITWGPIVYITNRGVGQQVFTMTEIKHYLLTGRLPNGENLSGATRSIGSGTRNGMMNTSGIDPSFGMGDNIDAEWTSTSSNSSGSGNLGPNRRLSNAQGSSGVEAAVINNRLGIGYTGLAGASRAAEDAQAGRYEIVDIIFDDRGGSLPVRPTISASLINCDPDTGFTLGGPVTLVTRGSIDQDSNIAPDYMSNQVARLYLRNIVESIEGYASPPELNPNNQSPADYLVTNFTLLQAQNCVASLNDPTLLVSNPNFNQDIQDDTLDFTTTITPPYGSVNPAGFVPRRSNVAAQYADEAALSIDLNVAGAVQYGYYNSIGAQLQFGLLDGGIVSGTQTYIDQKLSERNEVQGDFNYDKVRDINDIPALMVAVSNPLQFEQVAVGSLGVPQVPNGGWLGNPGDMNENVVIAHVLGDFDGTGNLDSADVRYFADGLALVPNALAGTGKHLDRQQGFTSVDNSWLTLTGTDNNYFNTVIHDASGTPTGSYSLGDARGDIAGATPWPGAQPKGSNGIVNCDDVLYIAANLGDFTDPADAVFNVAGNGRLDLSADMDGNLVIDCEDIAAVLAIMGETDLSACGLVAGCQKPLCPADVAPGKGDGQVGIADLLAVIGDWGCTGTCASDVNSDASVGIADLLAVIGAWGPCN